MGTRRIRTLLLIASAIASLGLAALPPTTASAAPAAPTGYSGPSAVLASATSSKVTIIAGPYRRDLTLQPTAQVIAGSFTGRTDIATALLYNPGSGRDGMLRYWVADGKIETEFQPMSISGRYQPFVVDWNDDAIADIFWYAPGPAPDFLWLFQPDGTYTDIPQQVGGEYVPVPLPTGTLTSDGRIVFQSIIWYAPGPAQDWVWKLADDGTYTSQPMRIDGRYRPVVGSFQRSTIMDGPEVLWYSQHGPDYLWSFGYDPAEPTTTRMPDIGPGARLATGRYRHPEGFPYAETLFTYFPGSRPESYIEQETVGGPYQTYGAGNIVGDYRLVEYGDSHVLLLERGTTGQILHLGTDGMGGTIRLQGLPPAAHGASQYLSPI